METKEFINSTIKAMDKSILDVLEEKMIGEYITYAFLDDRTISVDEFAEKVFDYFEKVELRTGDNFDKLLSGYLSDWEEVVKRYVPKDPSAKKDEPLPPMPRSKKYYKHAIEIKGSRNMTMKQIADYSRIMMSLYMSSIKANMAILDEYVFSTEVLDLDKIINALKAEKAGIVLPIGKKTMFDLDDLYCKDTCTFIITMILFSYIKMKEVKGD